MLPKVQKFHTFNLVIGKRMNGTGGEHQLERRCSRTVKVKLEMMAFAGELHTHPLLGEPQMENI